MVILESNQRRIQKNEKKKKNWKEVTLLKLYRKGQHNGNDFVWLL
jgi:hypothetical protein